MKERIQIFFAVGAVRVTFFLKGKHVGICTPIKLNYYNMRFLHLSHVTFALTASCYGSVFVRADERRRHIKSGKASKSAKSQSVVKYSKALKSAKSKSKECTIMVVSDVKEVESPMKDGFQDESIECLMDAADMGKANQMLPLRASIAQLSKLKNMLKKGDLIPGESTLDPVGAAFNAHGLTFPPGLDIAAAVRKNGNNSKKQNKNRRLALTGVNTILVVKVIDVNNKQRSESCSMIGDNIFGTQEDPVNLKSQMSACSFGQLSIQPGSIPAGSIPAGEDSAPGVIQVQIDIALDGGLDRYNIHNAVTAKVQEKLNIILPGPYNQVMYVLEKCYTGCGWAAYAYINSWMSVYQNDYYKQVAIQMHGEL